MYDSFWYIFLVLSQALAVPIAGDTSPFLVPTNYDSTLTPVQENIIKAYECLRQVRESNSVFSHCCSLY